LARSRRAAAWRVRKLSGVVLAGMRLRCGAAAQVSAQVRTKGKKMILTATCEVPVPEAQFRNAPGALH